MEFDFIEISQPSAALEVKYPSLVEELDAFREFVTETRQWLTPATSHADLTVPAFVNEFWMVKPLETYSL